MTMAAEKRFTLAGAIVHMLLAIDYKKKLNVSALATYLTDELIGTSTDREEVCGFITELETHAAMLRSIKENTRASDLAHEIERAVSHLLTRVRKENVCSGQHKLSRLDPYFEPGSLDPYS